MLAAVITLCGSATAGFRYPFFRGFRREQFGYLAAQAQHKYKLGGLLKSRVVVLVSRPAAGWIAGVLSPLVLLVFDPGVFSDDGGRPVLGTFKAFCYVGIAAGVITMTARLLTKRGSTVLAGVLAGSSLLALGVGIALLPLTVLGTLMAGIGILGLVPFATAIVFGWQALRAHRETTKPRRFLEFFGAVAIYFGACAAAQWQVTSGLTSAVADVCSPDPALRARGVAWMHTWRMSFDLYQVITAWIEEPDAIRKARIGAAYRQLTGWDIENVVSD